MHAARVKVNPTQLEVKCTTDVIGVLDVSGSIATEYISFGLNISLQGWDQKDTRIYFLFIFYKKKR